MVLRWYGRRGVEEVDAEVEGGADGGEGLFGGHVAEDVAEGGGAESDAAKAEPGGPQLPSLESRGGRHWDLELVLGF